MVKRTDSHMRFLIMHRGKRPLAIFLEQSERGTALGYFRKAPACCSLPRWEEMSQNKTVAILNKRCFKSFLVLVWCFRCGGPCKL